MRKIILMFAVLTIAATSFAQSSKKVEVLYFKANLSCCQAKACNTLEADVKKVLETKFNGKSVNFKEIKLGDAANAELVKKYNAKSQTVVIVSTKNGNDTSKDVSNVISEYAKSNDFAKFEKELSASINAGLK